jgi:hypothetical protein
MKMKSVRLVVDDAAVASAKDATSLLEPMWQRVDIYGSWARYEATLRSFSISQRHLFAIEWYRLEVLNGGHEQFFANSTGIVWEHAVEGLGAVGLAEVQTILKSAAERLGDVSRDRGTREARVEAAGADFQDLDDRFDDIDSAGVIEQRMLAFAREHAADFRFDGTVERPVLRHDADPRLLN